MVRERPYPAEQERFVIEAYVQTFVSRRDAYPWQQPDGKFVAVRRPLALPLIEGHLKGLITLGTYALDAHSMAKWVCIDADTDEQWTELLRVASRLEERSLPVYRERSRRGSHLWLFTSPLPGILIRRFTRQLLTEQGLDPDHGSPKPLEIYPRQAQLVDDGLGSLMRLPLGVHRKTGKIYPFVDRHDQPLARTPRDLLPIIANPVRIPLPFIMKVVARSPQTELPQPTAAFRTTPTRHLKDRPPSERILAAISTLDFVRQYVKLDSHNRGYCPFHDDEHQSFNVVDSGNYWNCFAGCGGGNLIHFWSKWRSEHGQDGSFVETVRDLLRLLGL